MPPVRRQTLHVAGDIIAADHVEHDVDAASARDLLDPGDEILALVVDRMIGAMGEAGSDLVIAARRHDHRDAEQVAQRNRHRADPAGAAMDQRGVAFAGIAALEQIGPHGEQRFGHRRRLDHRQRDRHRQALAKRRDDIFRIAPARDQRAHRLADQIAGHIGADRDDLARDFKAQYAGGSRWRGIGALPLDHIGPVHAGRGDTDQHIAGSGHRNGTPSHGQHFWPARFGWVDGAHFGWQAVHPFPLYP